MLAPPVRLATINCCQIMTEGRFGRKKGRAPSVLNEGGGFDRCVLLS